MSDQVITNNLVQTNLQNATLIDHQAVMDTYYEVNQTFSGRKMLDYMKSLQIYNSSKELVYDLGYDKLRPDDIAPLVKQINDHKGNDIWTHVVTVNGVDCIVLAREIHSRSNWFHTIGYVFIAIKESLYSRDIYEDVNMGEGADLFMIDTAGSVLSSRSAAIPVGVKLSERSLMNQIALNEKEGQRAFTAKIKDNTALVAFSYDSAAGWYLVTTIPSSYLNKESRSILPYLLMVCVVCFLVSLLLTFVISGSISKPLHQLTHSMKNVASGNLQTSNEDVGKDEIGFLSGKFNTMVEQISDLVEHTKEEQIKKREIELQMLQAQINPHFLFNTLNSLKWTAVLNQATNVSDGLSALAELLRNTIVNRKEMISLSEELKNIENYMVIQRLRFGALYEIDYQIEDGLMNSRVLKFILQPIVENSIIHGLDENNADNKIRIGAQKQGNRIEITVQDNGKGMPMQQALKLLDSVNQAEQRLSNIGISNVNERIKLHFGEEYGLQIHSEIGVGTKVSLTMPFNATGGSRDDQSACGG
ncbi:sensor histidine kinase [Paenibacillus alba]|uniref:sensor histidine kinase n=1 Tax=Paenibacillus alba TaxID=1197127 RepID=UPI0015660AA1|nr:histidine kinase [Paenibacillus alba]NQX68005.1 sensor histidine kinase [Paenibacillus alba]